MKALKQLDFINIQMNKPLSSLIRFGFYSLTVILSLKAHAAETLSNKEQCIVQQFKQSSVAETYKNLEQSCEALKTINKETTGTNQTTKGSGVLTRRLLDERQTAYNPFVITPHKRNYILLATVSDDINQNAYADFAGSAWQGNLSDTEAKFQLSIKVPLSFNHLLRENDGLFLGFTLQAWWQVYSEKISKPFRETNYQPEIFYLFPLNWQPKMGGNTALVFGLEHESNGRSLPLSRSWNRFYSAFLFEIDNFVLNIRPWWRLPERQKTSPTDVKGDDNPDIENYMGHFQFTLAHKWKRYETAVMTRRNFRHDKGAFEISFTFPLWGKLRGYAQYFNGYGESLVDYNYRQQRFGIGFALTGLL